jgi:hypothetical protein
MTQEEINKKVVDVVYDNEQIYHVMEPNPSGIRGVPVNQYLIRDTIESIKAFLSHLEQSKILAFENELAML